MRVRFVRFAAAAVVFVAGAAHALAAAVEPFPLVRPATRAQAVSTMVGGAPVAVKCLSAILQTQLEDPSGAPPATRRALAFLQAPAYLPAERRFTDPDGTLVRFTTHRTAFDRVDPSDEDRNGIPDKVEVALDGLAEARRSLELELGLRGPDSVELLLARVGAELDGYLVPSGGAGGRPLLVLDAASDDDRLRAAVIHQFAHAVARTAGSGVPPDWAEAFATWAVATASGSPDDATVTLLANRLRRLDEGLTTDSIELAAGNAAWLAFLVEAYGKSALRLAIEELGNGATAPVALDRAVRGSGGAGLAEAFRDFQLWSLLTGERATGRQFSFAARLPSPEFASISDGLPALSVQADPPVAALGAAAMLLNPDVATGGLSVRFEGEAAGRWDADLLLTTDEGRLHRIPFGLVDGKGEATVPAADIREAMLLVRNLDTAEGGTRLEYSWSARAVRGYPFETASLEATLVPAGKGVRIVWETHSEHGLVGFNVVRREGTSAPVRVNPVFVPALGDEHLPAAYEFFDRTALPGVAYTYAIEGITTSGLASVSDPVLVTRVLLSR